MNILMLGGTGFIGTHVARHLVSAGHKLRIFSRHEISNTKQDENIEFIRGSFNEMDRIPEILEGIDVVCHFISTTVPGTSNKNPVADIEDNLVSTVKLLEMMRATSVRRIIYLSSGGTVYGNSAYELIPESAPCNPICSYGINKLAIENYLYMYQELYNFQPLVLRVSNPYGPGQSSTGLQGIIPTYLTKVAKHEKIEIWGDGKTVRDYIFIDDLAELCVSAINSDVCGVFNAGSGQGATINSLVEIIKNVTDTKIVVNYTCGRAFDVESVVLDISKAKLEFEWQPKTNLINGIRQHYEWLKST